MKPYIAEKLKSFFSTYEGKMYPKGALIIRAEENPAGIFYLEKGVVRQYALSKTGQEVVLTLYKPPAFFPLMWAINDTPNRYYFEAINPALVRRAPAHKVIQFLKDEPEVLFDLISRLYSGMEGLLLKIEHLMSGTAYTKLIVTLMTTAKRFGVKTKDGLRVSLTEKELAAQTGIARETVSRQIQVLKKAGLITHQDNSYIICNLPYLEQLVGTTELH